MEEIDLVDPDTYVDGYPHDYLKQIRDEDPVHWNPPGRPDCSNIAPVTRGHWAITKHADVLQLSRMPKVFSSYEGSIFSGDLPEEQLAAMRLMIINMDPPIHTQQRRIMQPAFTPKMVSELEPRIDEYSRLAVDAVATSGSCDFVSDLAAEMPLLLICELMGIPNEDRRKVFAWANEMMAMDDPTISSPEGAQLASAQAFGYALQLAAERRATPDDSLMSHFLHRKFEGRTVSEDEIAIFFTLLLVAGTETTQTATARSLLLLSEHPEQKALLLSDLDKYLESAIEEILRFDPPAIAMRRTALEDFELRGKKIAKGDKVIFYYAAANRDPEVFQNPDRFDIARNPNPHVSFGIGQHLCLGANLARMQLKSILREVFTRLPDIDISGPVVRRRTNLVSAFNSMPVSFTPE